MNHDQFMVSTRLDENRPGETKALETLREIERRLARFSLKVRVKPTPTALYSGRPPGASRIGKIFRPFPLGVCP
jgi:hypothetical protein